MGQLEFERTKRILQRFLPSPPAIVVDVGGGTGPYSFWLSELGYETYLTDRSERLLELCKSRTEQTRKHPVLARLKSGTQDRYRGRMRRVTWS
jgi:ubiquinone/menaquinone biosynthesis C-methylase UbiE